MIAEIRTYVANRGMLEALIELLNDAVFPNHSRFGIRVVGLWTDRKMNQVTWIREFASQEDRRRQLESYEDSEGRKALLPRMATLLARPPQVDVVEDVFVAARNTNS